MYAVRWHGNVQRTQGHRDDLQALAPYVPGLSHRRTARLRDGWLRHRRRHGRRRRTPRRRGHRHGPVAGAAQRGRRPSLAARHGRGDGRRFGARCRRDPCRHRRPGPHPHRRSYRHRSRHGAGGTARSKAVARRHRRQLGARVAHLRRRARAAGRRGLRRLRLQRRAGRHRPDRPGAPPGGPRMSLAGLVLIVLPIAFNVAFGMLAARFDYPDVLRKPTHEVLAHFREGGRSLVLLWWAFALIALALAPAVVLLSDAIGDADGTLLAVATVTGVLAALVQLLGLIRWPFLVPYLARVAAEPERERGAAGGGGHRLPGLQPLFRRRGRRAPRVPA